MGSKYLPPSYFIFLPVNHIWNLIFDLTAGKRTGQSTPLQSSQASLRVVMSAPGLQIKSLSSWASVVRSSDLCDVGASLKTQSRVKIPRILASWNGNNLYLSYYSSCTPFLWLNNSSRHLFHLKSFCFSQFLMYSKWFLRNLIVCSKFLLI